MRADTIGIVVALAIGALAVHGQSDRPEEPASADGVGRAAFDRHCVHCHGPGAEAVGTVQLARTRGPEFALLTERSDLAAPYIDFIVRNGLKAMPAFVPSDLTEADLDALTDYLTQQGSRD